MSRTEIAEALGNAIQIVSVNIRKLIHNKEIDAIEINREEAAKLFGKNYKRRMRLYKLKIKCSVRKV